MFDFYSRFLMQPVPSVIRYSTTRRLFAFSTLVLLFVTHKLWFPTSEFPIVPLISLSGTNSVELDWGLSIILVVLLVAWMGIRERSKFAVVVPACIVVVLSALILLNQHRAKPWAYLTGIACILIAGLSPERAFAGLRLLFISVYFYSAISKLDYLFVHKMGQLFIDTGFDLLRINPGLVSKNVRLACIFGIPIFELLTAFALLFRKTRRIGIPMATIMHVGLLALLGPFGLDHKPAVLIWNLFFIAFIILLFNRSHLETDDELDFGQTKTPILKFGAIGILSIALIAPAFESLGWWEQWPSWSLYADRAEKAEVFVRRDRLVDLPPAVRNYFGPSGSNDEWSKLYVEAWAIGETDSPAYPQSRFYLGLAIDLAQRCRLGEDIRVNLYGIPNRWTGSRQAETIVGQDTMVERAMQFRMHALPRSPQSR